MVGKHAQLVVLHCALGGCGTVGMESEQYLNHMSIKAGELIHVVCLLMSSIRTQMLKSLHDSILFLPYKPKNPKASPHGHTSMFFGSEMLLKA